jgi:predicted HicB family RNase H-like nuclease
VVEEKKEIVTSLRVDPELWKKAKIEAIKYDLTLGRLVDEAIKEWIEKRGTDKKK